MSAWIVSKQHVDRLVTAALFGASEQSALTAFTDFYGELRRPTMPDPIATIGGIEVHDNPQNKRR